MSFGSPGTVGSTSSVSITESTPPRSPPFGPAEGSKSPLTRLRSLSFHKRKPAEDPFAWSDLPEAVQFLVVEFLDLGTLLNVARVSRSARDFALHDILWRPLFQHKFKATDKECAKIADGRFARAFASRLATPEPGDQVQVLWEGSFNLVSHDGVTGYEGRAWWEARIVERDGDDYKIHYPQWDSAIWDEWVSRERIRWPPDNDDRGIVLKKGDVVEVKCLSTSGRSPWLESSILKVDTDGRYFVGNSIVSGERSVPRENVRLVRRPLGSRHRLGDAMPKCAIM